MFRKSQTIQYLTHHSQGLWQGVHLFGGALQQSKYFWLTVFLQIILLFLSNKFSISMWQHSIMEKFFYIKIIFFSFCTEMTFTLLLQITTPYTIRKNEDRMIQIFLVIWRIFFSGNFSWHFFLFQNENEFLSRSFCLKLVHVWWSNRLLCHRRISKWYPIVKGIQDYSIISGLIVSKSSY